MLAYWNFGTTATYEDRHFSGSHDSHRPWFGTRVLSTA